MTPAEPSPFPFPTFPSREDARNRGRAGGEGGPSVPALAGPAPGEETVDFRPTSGPPSLLGRETAKTKKATRHISPISPTKQESIGTEEFGPPGLPPLLPESRPADPRTPDMLAFALLMPCLSVRSPRRVAPWTGTAEHRVPAPVGADTRSPDSH